MDHVETDLSLKNMTAFANQVFSGFQLENISSAALPAIMTSGTAAAGTWVWTPRPRWIWSTST